MAVTRGPRSIIMTAAADTVNQPLRVSEIRFSGTGLTAGQKLTIKDRGATTGKVIVDHYVTASNEDMSVFTPPEPLWIDRPYVDAVPATGTWTLIFSIT